MKNVLILLTSYQNGNIGLYHTNDVSANAKSAQKPPKANLKRVFYCKKFFPRNHLCLDVKNSEKKLAKLPADSNPRRSDR